MESLGRTLGVALLIAAALWVPRTSSAQAVVPGETGVTFDLTASADRIDTPDGDKLLMWGYGTGSEMQYPGPTLIVEQGATITVNLTNELDVPTSIVFPGQSGVTASGGTPGMVTREAPANGGTVSYSFEATHAGTYLYQSGTQPELQLEMGLLGAIIVRPTGFDQVTNRTAYGHPDTAYDHEYLFLLTEADPTFHHLVDLGFTDLVDNTEYFPVLWFINGRNGVDTLSPTGSPGFPLQPYGSLARTRPGEKVLLRFVGGGRDSHPFHPHGNHSRIIARDGRMLESTAGAGPDLAVDDFTVSVRPGATMDALFSWTGKKLGWDIYGDPSDPDQAHTCVDTTGDSFDDVTSEWCPDHGKPLPVSLPSLLELTQGGWWSGSPFLGQFGNLSPGEGGLNLNGGLFFMWHSHNEKELTNNDIFPGGMLTFIVIEPPGVAIP